MPAPGLVSPGAYPFRDPRAKSLNLGRTINRPRYLEVGGAYGQHIFVQEGGNKAYAQMSPANVARLEKPTSVKATKKSSRKND